MTTMMRSLGNGFLGLLAMLGLWSVAGSLRAASAGSEVVVIYNSRVPESREVAQYYTKRREVPPDQVFGFDLPATESMTRKEYLDDLEGRLFKKLEQTKLFTFGPATNKAPDAKAGDAPFRKVTAAQIRYAVLCYGVPTKIQKDPALVESATAGLPPELQRNEAA